MNFSKEMIEKAKNAKSAEELLEMVAENGINLTAEEAESYFAQLHKKVSSLADAALADEELENVSGGSGCPFQIYDNDPPYYMIVSDNSGCNQHDYAQTTGLPNNHCCPCCSWCYPGTDKYLCHRFTKNGAVEQLGV